MFNKLIALIFCLAMFSCNRTDNHFTVHIDPTFTPSQTEDILNAMQAWSKLTDGRASFETKYGFSTCLTGDAEICLYPIFTSGLYDSISNAPGSAGYTHHSSSDDDSMVYIPEYKDMYNDNQFTYIFTHELGHAMGLQHVLGEENVMYWHMQSPAQTLTCSDFAQWADIHGGGSVSSACPHGGVYVLDPNH